ncbi:MAG: hypothetical protein RLZZ50_1403, partial [Verrucomicrobiota bacterium]
FAGHVTVVSRLARPGLSGAADTVYLSSTYTDATPNNNGLATGDQSAPLSPAYSPRFNAFGLAFSGAYIGSTNTSSVQFSGVEITFRSGAQMVVPVISFQPLADRAYSTAPITLVASSSSGLPVTFSVVSGPATIEGAELTLTGTGTVTVRASQSGTATVLPAASVDQSFAVTKIPATVLLDDVSTIYDGSPKSVAVATEPAGLPVVLNYDGQSNPPSAVGTYLVSASIEDPVYQGEASGTLIIQPVAQTIDFQAIADRVFGDAPVSLRATSTSGLPVAFSLVSGPASLEGDNLSLTGAGAVTVRASQEGDLTRAPAPGVERTFQVAKAPALVLLGNLSATYDGAAQAPSAAGTYPVLAVITDPNHSGSAAGSLVIASPLVAPSVAIIRNQDNYELRVPSLSGHVYQLQRATDLAAGDWTNLGAVRNGTGGTILFTDPALPALPRRFYRIVISPASP